MVMEVARLRPFTRFVIDSIMIFSISLFIYLGSVPAHQGQNSVMKQKYEQMNKVIFN